MTRTGHRSLRVGAPILTLGFAAILGVLSYSLTIRAQSHDAGASKAPARGSDSAQAGPPSRAGSPPESRPEAESRKPKPKPSTAAPVAVAGFEGRPSPGEKITLKGEGSQGADHVRWLQTLGPPVALDDPTSPAPSLTLPEGAGRLGFALFVSNAKGTDVASLEIRVPGRERAGAGSKRTIVADAGDDQVGIVGRQITLNGSRSEPKGQVGYCWLQVAGPRVRLELDDGYIHSFVPQAPGIYEFALVVAQGGEMSRPDHVSISVGSPSSRYGIEPTPEAPESVHDVARSALAEVPGGLEVAEPLGEAFDGVADRMDLYRSYTEAYSELSRRLEPLLPVDPARRGVWDDRLFNPLTARLVDGMRAEGLDLRRADAQTTPLTSGQRARLAELFRSMSRGFRATSPRS